MGLCRSLDRLCLALYRSGQMVALKEMQCELAIGLFRGLWPRQLINFGRQVQCQTERAIKVPRRRYIVYGLKELGREKVVCFQSADTAGKCHGRGFMAFDWRGTDTCHGVGTALHMRSKIGPGCWALYHQQLDSVLTPGIHHSSPRAANTARTRTKLLTENSNQSMRDCANHSFVRGIWTATPRIHSESRWRAQRFPEHEAMIHHTLEAWASRGLYLIEYCKGAHE
ncbi:hypothetical protein B0H14DRAFT_2596538 [Mycena olivaceomarginata]|nr:hypothetical protein B0H14DRAFT_2596538 [Mycena olivaceomarginata]